MTQTPTSRRNPRWALRAAIAVLLAVALTGCLKLDMELSIEADTVNGTMVVAVDRQMMQLFEMEPDDIFDDADEDEIATIDGVTTTPYEDDDWIGVEYTLNRVLLDDLNELAADDEESPQILYDEQDGTYEFSMTVDLSDFFGEDELDEDDDLGFPGLDPAALQEDFEVRVAVTFPGEVTDHNGQVAGTTVTWTPEPGERTEMRAVALATGSGAGDSAGDPAGDTAGGGLPGAGTGSTGSSSALVALLVALGVLVLVAIGGITLWLTRRNLAPAAAVAAPGTEAAAGTEAGPRTEAAPAPGDTAPAGDVPTDPNPTKPDSADGTPS